jgi:hypothetical protein
LELSHPLLFSQEISTLSKPKRRKNENDDGNLYTCEDRNLRDPEQADRACNGNEPVHRRRDDYGKVYQIY